MPDISVLAPWVDDDPRSFPELDASCGRFIDAWLDAGGEPTDEAIIGFYGLWAQSLDARGKDEAAFYDWAYPLFIRDRDEVRESLRAAPPQI